MALEDIITQGNGFLKPWDLSAEVVTQALPPRPRKETETTAPAGQQQAPCYRPEVNKCQAGSTSVPNNLPFYSDGNRSNHQTRRCYRTFRPRDLLSSRSMLAAPSGRRRRFGRPTPSELISSSAKAWIAATTSQFIWRGTRTTRPWHGIHDSTSDGEYWRYRQWSHLVSCHRRKMYLYVLVRCLVMFLRSFVSSLCLFVYEYI